MKPFLILLLSASLSAQTFVNGARTQVGPTNYCVDSGGTDTYACSLSPAIAGYVSGNAYRFKANTANTGPATLNLNSIGAITIKKVAGGVTSDLVDNDIRANQIVDVVYDGTNFQLQSTLGNVASSDPNAVTAAGTLTSNLPMIGGGSKAAAVGTRSGNTTEFATVTGTKTVDKQLKFDASGNIVASATDIGAGGGGSSISVDWYPYPQQGTFTTTNDPNNSVAVCHVIYNQNARLSYGVGFEVNTISGTCSGTCYLSFAIYDSSKNLIAVTENAESGHGTARRDINATGLKRLAWSSGSAVSGGVFTWPAGKFWQCSMNTSAVIRVSAWTSVYWMRKDNYVGDEHGYKAITSGSPPAWDASWSGTLTFSGAGAEALDVKHLGSAP